MSYHAVAFFTQTGVLIFFVVLFLAVLAYALSPANGEKFARAARAVLDDDEADVGQQAQGRK